MAKPYDGDWVLRSVLFVPGHIEKMLHKAAGTKADCIVLDLEDAVPDEGKDVARSVTRSFLEKANYPRKTVFVRVNSFETGLTEKDLEGVACRAVHGFVYPWANSAEDIEKLDDRLGQIERNLDLPNGRFSVIAVIESPRGILNVAAIAQASSRMVGLIFGCEDYLAEMQGRHSVGEASLVMPRAQVAMAARAANIEPIDSPYVRIHDLEGLRAFAETGRDLGMAGMCALTPGQIPVINEVYTPSEEEIQLAREILAATESEENSERGVFLAGDKFISPPTLKAARKTIARYEAIHDLEAFYG